MMMPSTQDRSPTCRTEGNLPIFHCCQKWRLGGTRRLLFGDAPGHVRPLVFVCPEPRGSRTPDFLAGIEQGLPQPVVIGNWLIPLSFASGKPDYPPTDPPQGELEPRVPSTYETRVDCPDKRGRLFRLPTWMAYDRHNKRRRQGAGWDG